MLRSGLRLPPAEEFSADRARVGDPTDLVEGMSMGLARGAGVDAVVVGASGVALRVSGAVAAGRVVGVSPAKVFLPPTGVRPSF